MYVLLSAPTHSQEVWRIRHNEELYEMYKDMRLSTYIQIKKPQVGRSCYKDGRQLHPK